MSSWMAGDGQRKDRKKWAVRGRIHVRQKAKVTMWKFKCLKQMGNLEVSWERCLSPSHFIRYLKVVSTEKLPMSLWASSSACISSQVLTLLSQTEPSVTFQAGAKKWWCFLEKEDSCGIKGYRYNWVGLTALCWVRMGRLCVSGSVKKFVNYRLPLLAGGIAQW